MNINGKTWHLRLVRKILGQDYEPLNLCTYFWTLLIVGAGSTLLLPFIPIVLFGMGCAWVTARFVEIVGSIHINMPTREPRIKTPKAHEPSLLWAWVKSRKNKVCPLISVEEER